MKMKSKYLTLLWLWLGCAILQAEPKRVLLLCDPVQLPIAQEATKQINGGAQVTTIPKTIQAYHSAAVLEQLDAILGDQKWDIIYFNFGIADLIHRNPATKDFRIMNKDGGGQPTSLEEYEKNLNQIIQRLKSTKAKLIWGSTTPLVNVHFFPTFEGGLYEPNSELKFNLKAADLMSKNHVQIVDLHAHIMKHLGPDEKHPPYNGYPKLMLQKEKPLHLLLQAAMNAN